MTHTRVSDSNVKFGFTVGNWLNVFSACHCRPIKVLPVPGGPNSSRPFGGPRKPVNMSLKPRNQHIHTQLQNTYIVCAVSSILVKHYTHVIIMLAVTASVFLRSQHRPNDNLFDGFLGKLQASNIFPCDRRTVVHDLQEHRLTVKQKCTHA